MTEQRKISSNIILSVVILSAGLIAYQLALLQILSLTQWYHFAYMIISIALLGWGVAGTCLTLFRKFIVRNSEYFLPFTLQLSAIFMLLVIYLTQLKGVYFDSFLLFTSTVHIGRFLLSAFLYMIPFLCGAMGLGIIFILYTENIGKIYCANLIGSGAGGIAAVVLAWGLMPMQIPIVLALFPLVGSLFLLGKWKKLFIFAFLLIFVTNAALFFLIKTPVISEYKGLSRVLDMPGAKVQFSKNSPYGFVQIVSAPSLRMAPCLSLKYKKTCPVSPALFLNGENVGNFIPFSDRDTVRMFRFSTSALPYYIRKQNTVLLLNVGTGKDIALALNHKVKSIDAIEPNPVISGILKKQVDEINSKPDNPITLYSSDELSFLKRTKRLYDLIAIPPTNYFGGNAGLNAMQTQEHLTVEAINEMWSKLSNQGILAITCWQDYPPRHTLKISATVVKVLADNGINNPRPYLIAIKSWGDITFFLSKIPYTNSEVKQIRAFCSKMLFDPVILPVTSSGDSSAFNLSDDRLFAQGIQKILKHDKQFQEQYEFNILPATKDRPYFSQFIKWRFLPHLLKLYGKNNVPFIELGFLIVALTLIVLSIFAIFLIILPLFFIGWRGQRKFSTLLYFGGIGLGYMFVEVVFIQYFIFYLGNVVYSAAAVISSMLICSGLGSWLSDRKMHGKLSIAAKIATIILLLIIYGIFLGNFLYSSIGLPFGGRMIITFALTGLPAFFMGMPFPIGLKNLSIYSKEQVPWGWGINSYLSVISPLIAIIVSVELGFSWVFFLAGIAYFLTLLASKY